MDKKKPGLAKLCVAYGANVAFGVMILAACLMHVAGQNMAKRREMNKKKATGRTLLSAQY